MELLLVRDLVVMGGLVGLVGLAWAALAATRE